MKFLWIFLVALFAACMPPRAPSAQYTTYTYTEHLRDPNGNTLIVPAWIDDNLPYGLKESTVNALGEWNIVLNGKMRFEVQTSGDEDRKRRQENEEFMLYVQMRKSADTPFQGVLGWWAPSDPAVVNIVGDLLNVTPEGMSTVIKHEIGHWFGLDHVLVRGTLMYPSYVLQGSCIDHVTVAMLAIQHAWDDRYLNYCTQ